MTTPLPITVLGAGGWVGAALVAQLRRQGQPVQAVGRAELDAWLAAATPAAVIYAIGLTADFRQRPHATAEAHVSLLSRVLQRPGLKGLLYLSSTRMYGRSDSGSEAAPLACLSEDPSDLYNLSKLLGEALVLQEQRASYKVARLSNVVGPGQPGTTFLGQLLEEAANQKKVQIRQPADSTKDYVALADVVRLLPLVASEGQQRIYNLASGSNTRHREIAGLLEQRGVTVELNESTGGAMLEGCSISIGRLRAEFPPPAPGLEACRQLILGPGTPGHRDGSAI